MTIKRKGSAVWSGGLKDGKGAVSTGSGVLHLKVVIHYGVRQG